jgi:uncharacterized protein
MASKPAPDLFQQGIDLFNAGKFFECHETWEELWKRAHGTEKRFLQGMIQAAVAILHAERGNLKGARTLRDKSLEKLDALPDDYMGIALGKLRGDLRESFTAVLNLHADDEQSPVPPRIGGIIKLKRNN